jgi:hypothetical protein
MTRQRAYVALLATVVLAVAAGCGGESSGVAESLDGCRKTGPVTTARDGRGDVRPNIAAPTPPPGPRGIDLIAVSVARSAGSLCAVFELSAPPPGTAGFRVGLREAGNGDSGALVGLTALLAGGRRYVQLAYPGADDRPDRGVIPADIAISGNRVSLLVDTGTLPDWTPPADGSEWEASTIGFGDRPGLQYYDCAPERTQHVTYPAGRLVEFGNGRGSC